MDLEPAPAVPASRAASTRLLVAVAVLALIGLGVWLRCLGYFDQTNGIWWDEGSWIKRIGKGEFGVRPLGFSLISQRLIEAEPIETMVRLPSLVAGIVSLPLFVWLARRSRFSWAATLLGLFVLAVHPWALAYSKEFKPYAGDLACHLLVAAAAAAYFSRPGLGRLVGLGCAAAFAPLLSWTSAAAFPGIWAASLWSQWRRRAWRELAATVAVTLAAAVASVWLYNRTLSSKKLSADYWEKKYGVFYSGDAISAHASWLLEQSAELARLPGQLSVAWSTSPVPGQLLGWLCLILAVLGLARLVVERDVERLVVWFAPWLAVVGANVLDLWPYGVFRTNLFLLVYPLGLALIGFDQVRTALADLPFLSRPALSRFPLLSRRGLLGALAAALLAAGFFPWIPSAYAAKDRSTGAESTSIPRTLAYLSGQPGRSGIRLLMDRHGCESYRYYWKVHPGAKASYRETFRRLKPGCLDQKKRKAEARLAVLSRKGRFWLHVSKTQNQSWALDSLQTHCEVRHLRRYPTGDFLAYCAGPKKTRK